MKPGLSMEFKLQGLKICIIAGTLGPGGAERQLFYILKALKDSGADVQLLTLTQGEFWEENIRALNVPIWFVGQKKSSVRRVLKIIQTVSKLRPDLVQSMHFYTNIYTALAGKYLGKPSIGAIRADLISEIAANGKILGTLCFTLPNYIICNSLEAKATALKKNKKPEKIFYLPNVVDTDRFDRVVHTSSEAKVILTIGRLELQKKQDRFIRIVSRLLHEEKLNLKAFIIGAGAEKENLLQLTRECGLEEKLEFISGISNPELYYSQADVFILTSDFEGTPNVILEAMACSIPIVSTSIGNLPNIIDSGHNGFLIRNYDEDAMFSTVVNLLKNGAMQEEIGINARKTIAENFSPVILPRLLEKIYFSILNN